MLALRSRYQIAAGSAADFVDSVDFADFAGSADSADFVALQLLVKLFAPRF